MQAAVQTAVVHDTVQPAGFTVTLVAVDFGVQAEPLTIDDQIREARIQVEGLREHISMLEFAKTGVIAHRERAIDHMTRMMELIKGRSDGVRARLAAERGLPHA